MLIRDGRPRPPQEKIDAQLKKQNEQIEKEVKEARDRMKVDRTIFSRD